MHPLDAESAAQLVEVVGRQHLTAEHGVRDAQVDAELGDVGSQLEQPRRRSDGGVGPEEVAEVDDELVRVIAPSPIDVESQRSSRSSKIDADR